MSISRFSPYFPAFFLQGSWASLENDWEDSGGFFGGNSKEVRKTIWVICNQVCKDKIIGGLGVRGIEDFNLALLNKWKWRLLTDKKTIWFDILRVIYGNFEHTILSIKLSGLKGPISTWWRDLISFRKSASKYVFSFIGHVKFYVREGTSTPFWFEDWCGSPLFTLFPLLLTPSGWKQKRCAIWELGLTNHGYGDIWVSKLSFGRVMPTVSATFWLCWKGRSYP